MLRPAVAKAAADSRLFGRVKSPVSAVTGWLVVLVVLKEWGSETATSDYVLASVAGLVAGGLAPALGSFVWNLAAAPKRLADERADAATDRADALQAEKDAAVDQNAEAKRLLRIRLEDGARLRGEVVHALRPGGPIGPHVPRLDQWIATARVELDNLAPAWSAYFVADTGDVPQVLPAPGLEEGMRFFQKVNENHLARFDRHLHRLREIVYDKL